MSTHLQRAKHPPIDLIEGTYINHERTFPLPLSTQQAQHIRDAYWIALQDENAIVAEGKLFIPRIKPEKKKLIIFEGGMPGDGSCASIEKNYLSTFMQHGYHTLILRHLGAWIDADGRKNQESMIMCPERTDIGKKRGERTLGEQHPYNIQQLANEVVAATNIVGKHVDEIALIGHSSGALADLWAIPDIETSIRNRVTHIISLAGLTGGIENLNWLKRWGLRQHLARCKNYLNLTDPAKNIQILQDMFKRVYQSHLPPNTMLIQVSTPRDEFIHPDAARRYQEHLGRGLIIMDETQTEKNYHHLKNLRADTLLRLLKTYHPDAKHTVTVRRREPKK
ncbi:hypothetical protein HYZ98_02330 [Candidatus Peregrinibacteria bacterium]|nr:hypothetical protein [Candidatus Peregrinibacteria bacterium]